MQLILTLTSPPYNTSPAIHTYYLHRKNKHRLLSLKVTTCEIPPSGYTFAEKINANNPEEAWAIAKKITAKSLLP